MNGEGNREAAEVSCRSCRQLERAPSVRIGQNLPPEIDARFRKSPIRADRALRSAHLRHAECALYLRLSFVFIIHALEALYDLNNYDC